MPFYVSNDDYGNFVGDQWQQGAQGKVADQWAASAVADAPDRAAAAEQAAAEQQAEQARQQAAAQAQAVAEAQRQADEQAAAAQAQKQQADTWAANQWAAKSYDQAATAATGVAPAPAPAPQPAPQVDVNDGATQTAAAVGPSTPLPSSGNANYVAAAWQAAQNAGIDPNIFVRQIQQESGFQPFEPDGRPKKSPAGAIGIAQFMPGTAQDVGVDPTNPLASLDAAAKMMASYVQKYAGDYSRALAAYNAGPGNVDKFGGVPPFAETQSYVKIILGDAAGLGAQLAQRAKEGLGAAGQAVQDITHGTSGDHPLGPPPVDNGHGGTGQVFQTPTGDWNIAFGFNQPYGAAQFNQNIPNHRGVDLTIPGAQNNGRGTPYTAFQPGTVVALTHDPAGGNGIIVQTADGLYNRYFHNDKVLVGVGDKVDQTTQIGVLGASGTEGFPHLHFEVSRGINGDPTNQLIDPRPYMMGGGGSQGASGTAGTSTTTPAGQSGSRPAQPTQPQAQTMAQFIQQYQSTQGRMPTDTELGNFILSQPPEQTAASVGTPQPIQQPTSPFDVIGNLASGLGTGVRDVLGNVSSGLQGIFGGGSGSPQPPGPQGPSQQAPAATTSPFPGLPQLPTGMPPEGGGYGAGGPLLPGEAASVFAPVGQAVTGLASSPLLPTNLTNAGLQAVGQNVVAPGLEALAQPGGPLIGPRTAAAQALEGLAGQVPAGVPVVGGLLERAAGIVGGPTIVDAAQTASQIEQKYGGGLQITPDGRVAWRPPDYSRITPEDQNALSNAMLAVGGVTLPPGPEAGKTAAETGGAARQTPPLSTQESNFLQSHTLVPNSDPRPLSASQPGLPNVKAVMQQNLAEVLPGDAVLYHETSLPNARAILQRVEAGPRNQSIWTADTRDLALGQGGKGVTLEFDPALVNGGAGENPAKAFSAQAGMGTEYQVDKTLRGAVQAIVVNTQRQADQLAADPLIANRFDFSAAQQTPEGIRIPYAGPSRAPGAPAEVPSVALANVGEPTTTAGTPAVSPPEIARAGEPVAATAPASVTAGIAPPRAVADLPTAAPVSGTAGGNLPVEQIPEVQTAGGAGQPPIRPPTAIGAPSPAPEPEPGLLSRLTQGQPEQAGNITLSKYPEDVRQVISDAASSLPDQMKAATRGVVPDQAVRDLSQQTGMDVDQIVRNWNPGQAQNAETLLALRDALTAQARKVIDAQQTLRATPDSVAARGDLLEALTQHAAIQEVVSGSTAEAGRALRQFRQAAPGSDFATNQISQMAARSGMTPEEMVDALGRVDLSDPAAVAQLSRSLPQGPPTLAEIFRSYHVNNVISGLPTLTHVSVNSILAPAWSFTTRSLADLAGLNFDRVQGGGIGLGAGLSHAGEDFLTGFRDVLDNPASVANRLGGPGGAALKAQGVFGALHGAFQNVAQGIIERTEIGRLAGEAATDQGLKGAAWTKYVADALDNPAADMVQQARGVAERAALRGDLGTLGQKMQQIANVPFIGNTLFPVVKISTNALTQGIERSPLGLLGTGFDVARAARGVGPYAKGLEPVTGAVTPLGERLTNNLAGTAVTAFLVNKGLDGTITGDGPSDPKERAALLSQGWQPNSLYIPGRGYVDYRVLGPLAQDFALVGNYADAVEEARRHPGQPTLGQDALEIAGNLAQRQASYMSDATGLRTLGQIYEVLHGGAKAANVAAQFFGQMAGGFVPESAAVRGLVSAADPYARQPQRGDLGEVIAQGLPGGTPGIGGRTDLPVRLNELGQPESNPQAGLGIFVPRTGTGSVSPVMTLLGSVGLSPPTAPNSVRVGQREITLSTDEQRQYQQLRGALLDQMMTPLTQNQQFSQAPDTTRKVVLQRLVNQADQVAQRQLIGTIAQSGDFVSRLGPGPRQQEPVPFRPPIPLTELTPATSAATSNRAAPLPLTSDLATLDPLQQEQMRRQLAGTP